MKRIQILLVVLEGLDASGSDRMPIELEKALRLAQDKKSTQLVLLSVAYQKHLDHNFLSIDFDTKERQKEYCEGLLQKTNSLANKLKKDGYQVSASVEWGYPGYEVITAKAKEISADLIVKHCRAYGKIEFHHLSNDSWQLVRHCSIPLLLVKNEPWPEHPKVLAAIDPMHNHDKSAALDHLVMAGGKTLCDLLEGELHVVHAYAEAARPFAPAGIIKSEHSEALTEFLSTYNVPSKAVHFIDATPIMALEKEIDELTPAVVAMGSMSRSRISEMLIGSTAEQVMDFINTDILVLKSASK
jgi:universal stress protein E